MDAALSKEYPRIEFFLLGRGLAMNHMESVESRVCKQ